MRKFCVASVLKSNPPSHPASSFHMTSGRELATLERSNLSYLESSSPTAHTGLTRRATLESSVWGAIFIGLWKAMQITGNSQIPAKPITVWLLSTQNQNMYAQENLLHLKQ